MSQRFDSPWVEGLARMMSGRVLGKANPHEIDHAAAQITKAIGMFEETGMKTRAAMGYLNLEEVHADAGQREYALENLKTAGELHRETGLDSRSYWVARTEALLARL